MKTLNTILVLSLLVLSVVPGVFAVNVGTGIIPDINTEDFPPLVWMCDNRVVLDDAVEPGRTSNDGQKLVERINNYAFEGEQIQWKVLVMDKNGIDKVSEVFGTIGSSQGSGNDIEVNCKRIGNAYDGRYDEYGKLRLDPSCNARILEEKLYFFEPELMSYYDCTFTVETPESMYGEYWITVEAIDLDGLSGTMDENEFWFLNPVIALSLEGALTFDEVRPGALSYSDTLLIGNDADDGSGVMLDMFISGTDFYDSSSSGAKCPTTNQLELGNFRYFATSGAYSTIGDDEVGARGAGSADDRDRDLEGYVNIGYGDGFNDPTPFYDGFEILQDQKVGPYYVANVLAPGAEMALTFKLALPEPCNGDFDTGSIFFWGEAI